MTKEEQGMPLVQELTPLSQILISKELANAFSISHEASKTPADVLRASESTVSQLRQQSSGDSFSPFSSSKDQSVKDDRFGSDPEGYHHRNNQIDAGGAVADGERIAGTEHSKVGEGSGQADAATMANNIEHFNDGDDKKGDSSHEGRAGACDSTNAGGGAAKKTKRQQPDTADSEEADSDSTPENPEEDSGARTLKRPRLVWTPQLHKRFVDAVAHLGIKNAVPKTIMQLMNVEGLTRENVASHLQKYRLYLKRMQGASSDGPPTSDPLFNSTPIPPGLAAATHYLPFPVPMGHMTIGAPLPSGGYGGFEHHPYGAMVRASQGMAPAEQRQQAVESQGQASTSSQQVLTLFPTSNH
ncbi:hypothetical protein O6H91_16G075500 [Diphasiastrum complanatum]|uniref:Uncharacterized protein n=1 Tax=Diphasiastrum complanatum TaxID=34168 RepID=A0ACC2BDW4_DIPCM|nr:hypothetical protein O6H91_Y006300 [Diphasiastrum complanatum]KAJ7527905.1 hypothetical protein O6H91_16G075500 [Diphasiastrum complanatum]